MTIVERAITESGGAMRRKALVALVGKAAVQRALADGKAVRLGRLHVCLAGQRSSRDVAVQLGGVVSGLSAAASYGWSLKAEPDQVQVTVPRNRGRPNHLAALSRRDLAPGEVDRWRTRPIRTVLDCARDLPFDQALCVVDSALRERAVTKEALIAAAKASPRTGRSRALRVIESGDGRAANAFESTTRAIALGVPGLDLTVQIGVGIGSDGLPRTADLGDRRLRIIIECESWAWHSSPDAFAKDLRRYTDLALEGWLVLRFGWHEVMLHPGYVERAIARAVRLRTGRVPEGTQFGPDHREFARR